MENNKNKKSVKFQGDMLNFCDFIQVFVFTRNHHLNVRKQLTSLLVSHVMSCLRPLARQNFPALLKIEQTLLRPLARQNFPALLKIEQTLSHRLEKNVSPLMKYNCQTRCFKETVKRYCSLYLKRE